MADHICTSSPLCSLALPTACRALSLSSLLRTCWTEFGYTLRPNFSNCCKERRTHRWPEARFCYLSVARESGAAIGAVDRHPCMSNACKHAGTEREHGELTVCTSQVLLTTSSPLRVWSWQPGTQPA